MPIGRLLILLLQYIPATIQYSHHPLNYQLLVLHVTAHMVGEGGDDVLRRLGGRQALQLTALNLLNKPEC